MAQRDLLRAGRKALDKLMKTGIRVTFDPEGSGDDDFDYSTGRVFKPLNDELLVYDEESIGLDGRSLAHYSGLGGKAIVAPASAVTLARMQSQGGVNFATMPYEIHVPLDAPEGVGVGAVTEVVASEFPFSDPGLMGRQWLVRFLVVGTLSPARTYVAEERIRGLT